MKFVTISLLILLATAAQAQNSSRHGQNNLISSVPSKPVSSLPACNSATNGMIYLVTDALTPVVAVAIVGGGAVQVLTHCNGSNWLVG